jgi:hypothetical protein
MHSDKYKETAVKYYVDDLDGALIPGSRISNILKELELSNPISDNSQEFLQRKGLLSLLKYAKNEIDLVSFSKIGEIEQTERRRTAEALTIEKLVKQKLKEEALFAKLKKIQEQEEVKRCAFKNNPRNIAKAKQFALREKYGLSCFIEKVNFSKLMDMLRRVDNDGRLSEEDIVWLMIKRDDIGTGYFTEELRERYHNNEANFYRCEFENTKDPWFAVNASSHYRKCKHARKAESLLSEINMSVLKNRKLKSALCTTRGGVKRDLGKFDEALNLGKQAHEFTSQDFRPCTLIGAVYIETGHYELGQSWYKKAVELGYSEKSVDDELRGIFMRSEKSKREAFRTHLLNMDPERYSWVNKPFLEKY